LELCVWKELAALLYAGMEMFYEMYSPVVQKIELLRLEKRLDDELLYLRDALSEYSTFPLDMEPEYLPEGAPVPVNPIKVSNSTIIKHGDPKVASHTDFNQYCIVSESVDLDVRDFGLYGGLILIPVLQPFVTGSSKLG